MFPSQGGLLWSITSTKGWQQGNGPLPLTLGAQSTPTDMSSSPLCQRGEPPSLPLTPIHTESSPACVQCVLGDLTGPGRRDEGGSKRGNDGDGYPSQEPLRMQSNDSAEDQGRAQGQTLSSFKNDSEMSVFVWQCGIAGAGAPRWGAVGVSATPSRDPKPIGMNSPLLGQHLALNKISPEQVLQRAGCSS